MICEEGRAQLAEVLREYRRDIEDLQIEEARRDQDFGTDAGPGYWGSPDVDGDGTLDRVLRYEGVDFWSHLFFVARGPCFRFAGHVEGYQVQIVALPGGQRKARVLRSPVGYPSNEIIVLRWIGNAFVR